MDLLTGGPPELLDITCQTLGYRPYLLPALYLERASAARVTQILKVFSLRLCKILDFCLTGCST